MVAYCYSFKNCIREDLTFHHYLRILLFTLYKTVFKIFRLIEVIFLSLTQYKL